MLMNTKCGTYSTTDYSTSTFHFAGSTASAQLAVVVSRLVTSDVRLTSDVVMISAGDVSLVNDDVVSCTSAVVMLPKRPAALVTGRELHELSVEFAKIDGSVSSSNRAFPQVLIPRLRTRTANTFITSPARACTKPNPQCLSIV